MSHNFRYHLGATDGELKAAASEECWMHVGSICGDSFLGSNRRTDQRPAPNKDTVAVVQVPQCLRMSLWRFNDTGFRSKINRRSAASRLDLVYLYNYLFTFFYLSLSLDVCT